MRRNAVAADPLKQGLLQFVWPGYEDSRQHKRLQETQTVVGEPECKKWRPVQEKALTALVGQNDRGNDQKDQPVIETYGMRYYRKSKIRSDANAYNDFPSLCPPHKRRVTEQWESGNGESVKRGIGDLNVESPVLRFSDSPFQSFIDIRM